MAFLGLWLLALSVAHAQSGYKIDVIAGEGEQIGAYTVPKYGGFVAGTLNDNGEVVFNASLNRGYGLFVYANGKPIPIFVPGQKTPSGDGTFSESGIYVPVQMNRQGNIPFSLRICLSRASCLYETYLWDRKTESLKAIVRKGMPAVNGLTIEDGGGWRPAINNRDEIAFAARVKNAAGKNRVAIFFLGSDNKLLPVALPDEPLPDGGIIDEATFPTLNDRGMVAFLAKRKGDKQLGAYLWENGTITPVAPLGTAVSGGKTITEVGGAWLNEKDRSILVAASVVRSSPRFLDLYRFTDGKLIPVVTRGQDLPGGGRFAWLRDSGTAVARYVSAGNASGQHAFAGFLASRSTGIYVLNPDGNVSLVLQKSSILDTDPVDGISLNNKGQIATTIRAGGRTVLAVLTPTAP